MNNYLNTRYKKLKKAGYIWQDKKGKCYNAEEVSKEYLTNILNTIAFIFSMDYRLKRFKRIINK